MLERTGRLRSLRAPGRFKCLARTKTLSVLILEAKEISLWAILTLFSFQGDLPKYRGDDQKPQGKGFGVQLLEGCQ